MVTDGANGAWVRDNNGQRHIQSPKVVAVDTTGAGDMFAGVVAARLGAGDTLADADADAARVSEIVTIPRSAR